MWLLAAGSRPGKGPTVLIRGYAYLAGGSAEQAVKVTSPLASPADPVIVFVCVCMSCCAPCNRAFCCISQVSSDPARPGL